MPHDQEALWTSVDRYISDTLLSPDCSLDAALVANAAADLPPIDVAPNQGKFLQILAQLTKARRILEIGTLGGYSTIWLARTLPVDGKLISLEFEPKHAAVARSNIDGAGLSNIVEVRVGPALDSLKKLIADAIKPFDLIFIDADKPNNPQYLELSLQLSRLGTLMILDNIVRDGELANADSTDDRVQGQRHTLELIATNPRLSATALQTVGSKGYDGFAIALVVA